MTQMSPSNTVRVTPWEVAIDTVTRGLLPRFSVVWPPVLPELACESDPPPRLGEPEPNLPESGLPEPGEPPQPGDQ